MPEAIAQFAKAKYLNLETFRKTGVGVRTPVWFAQDFGTSSQATSTATPDTAIFYIYSAPDAGKVKRIRNNPRGTSRAMRLPRESSRSLAGCTRSHLRQCRIGPRSGIAASKVRLVENCRRLLQPPAGKNTTRARDSY